MSMKYNEYEGQWSTEYEVQWSTDSEVHYGLIIGLYMRLMSEGKSQLIYMHIHIDLCIVKHWKKVPCNDNQYSA